MCEVLWSMRANVLALDARFTMPAGLGVWVYTLAFVYTDAVHVQDRSSLIQNIQTQIKGRMRLMVVVVID